MWDPGERKSRWRRDTGEEQSVDDQDPVAAETDAPAAPEPLLEEPREPALPPPPPIDAGVMFPPVAEELEAVPPPSLRFETFVQLLDVLAERGLPTTLDERYFADTPDPGPSQFVAALRFFDLIDAQGQPLPRLILLIDDVARRRILLQLISTHYVRPMRIGLGATPGDVDAWFDEQGLKEPDKRRRAVAFLVDAADYAGMRLPGVTDEQARAELGVGPVEAEAAAEGAEAPAPALEPVPTAPEEADELLPQQTLEAKRSAYIDLLMDLVRASGDHLDDRLLDRIERVLAYPREDADEAHEPAPEQADTGPPRPARAAKKTAKKRAPRAKR